MQKRHRELARKINRLGLTVDDYGVLGSSHVYMTVTSPDGRSRRFVMPNSPQCSRSFKNMVADVKRSFRAIAHSQGEPRRSPSERRPP